ncbi:DMT family transporter [Sporolactobacillus sp. THM7-7]|nr:DMT family transporter [Sporolactobacillus sp. THM7-7]
MSKNIIYLILFGVMTSWGFNVIATKVLVEHFMPVTMTAFRIFTAGVFVFIILYFLKKIRLPTRKEWVYILFGGLFNVVGHHFFLSIGLVQTSAANGGLILGFGPLLTAILSILFLGNTITLPKLFGMILGIFGVFFIVFESNGGLQGLSLGDVSVFLSVLSLAVSFVLIKKVSQTLDPRLMTGYMLVLGSAILFVLSLFLEPDGMKSMTNGTAGLWAIFMGSAVIATAVGHMMYNFSIGKVGTVEASIFINLNPFFALVGAAFFLGEKILIVQIIGFVLILSGVMLGSGAFEELMHKRSQQHDQSR